MNKPEIRHLVEQDKVKGEKAITVFRLIIVILSLGVATMIIAENQMHISASDSANIITSLIGMVYSIVIFSFLIKNQYNIKFTYISSVLDVSLVTASLYFAQFAPDSSLASIVSAGSFAVYFPVVLLTVRRHNPANTLFTGIIAGVFYSGLIGLMSYHQTFQDIMVSPSGLMIKNDLINELIKSIMLIASGYIGARISKNTDTLFYKALYEQTEKEGIKRIFGQYVSKEVLQRIFDQTIPLDGEKKEATIMFMDLKNFTYLSENVDPNTLFKILNNFFTKAIQIIVKHNGFIDKFIGDAIMVVFGAPEDNEKHRQDAIRCALELVHAFEESEAIIESETQWKLDFGIGINTGEVLLGNVGNDHKKEYTAIGDAVNVASRLERYTRIARTKILVGTATITPDTEDLVDKEYIVDLKGKAGKQKIFQINTIHQDIQAFSEPQ